MDKLIDKQLEVCCFCLSPFDLINHIPYILSCGHTICKEYIDIAFSDQNKNIKCPLENKDLKYKSKEDIR